MELKLRNRPILYSVEYTKIPHGRTFYWWNVRTHEYFRAKKCGKYEFKYRTNEATLISRYCRMTSEWIAFAYKPKKRKR